MSYKIACTDFNSVIKKIIRKENVNIEKNNPLLLPFSFSCFKTYGSNPNICFRIKKLTFCIVYEI